MMQADKKVLRRRAILEAAAQVFAQRGFRAATVRDVARAAEIADGTLYNYFENKESLLLGVFELMTLQRRANVGRPPLEGLELSELVKMFLAPSMADFESRDFELFRVIVSEVMINRELGDSFRQRLLAPMLVAAEADFRTWSQVNCVELPHLELTVRTLGAVMIGISFQCALGDTELLSDRVDLPQVLSEILANGLGGREVQ